MSKVYEVLKCLKCGEYETIVSCIEHGQSYCSECGMQECFELVLVNEDMEEYKKGDI